MTPAPFMFAQLTQFDAQSVAIPDLRMCRRIGFSQLRTHWTDYAAVNDAMWRMLRE
jgi:hypothetical protein